MVVLVIHEKKIAVDTGPVFNPPSGEQQLTCVVKYIGESILGLFLTKPGEMSSFKKAMIVVLLCIVLFLMHYKQHFISGVWISCGSF